MRKFSFIFALISSLFFGLNAKAQTATPATTDYFPGKWNVIVSGTPNGDAKMTFVLERKDGKLGGAVQDSTGKELTKITSVDEKDKTATIAFSTQGYDVTLTLEPIDDDHVKGSLMGMFDAKGVRVKETK
jgi:hypothetical protein